MSDILMLADPKDYTPLKAPAFKTLWLSTSDFLTNDKLQSDYQDVLWKNFNTRDKYDKISAKADFFSVAKDQTDNYIASAFVIIIGDKWLVEYVMTDPDQQSKGAGSAVMDRLMQAARNSSAKWVLLNCDPDKHDGQLPKFYGRFGFAKKA